MASFWSGGAVRTLAEGVGYGLMTIRCTLMCSGDDSISRKGKLIALRPE